MFHMCEIWLQAWLSGYGYDVDMTRNSEGSGSFKLLPSQRTRILNGLSANDASPRFRPQLASSSAST